MKNKKILALVPLAIGGFVSIPNIAQAASTDPVAVTDNVTVPFGQNAELKVLANDNAGVGAKWSKVEIKEPDGSWGTTYDDNTTFLKVNSSNNIDFSVIQGFIGKDTPFTYRATNSLGKSVTGTINVTVGDVKSPIAVNDRVKVKAGVTNYIDVLKNDKRGEANSPLSGITFKAPNGSFVTDLTNSDGRYYVTTDFKVAFAANRSFSGVTKQPITYRAIDLNNKTSEATLTVYTDTATSSNGGKTTGTVTMPSKSTGVHHSTSTNKTSNGKTSLGPMVQTDNVSGSSNPTDIISALGFASIIAGGAGLTVAKKRK